MGPRSAEALEAGNEFFAELQRARQDDASGVPLGPIAERLQRRQHARLELRAEPLYRAQPLCPGGLLERLGRVDPELGVEQPGALGSEARQTGHRDQPGGELRAQLHGSRDLARVDQRLDLLLQRLADPRQLGRTTLGGEACDRDRRLADGLGRRAVGDDAVDDGAIELVEVAQLLESVGDHAVGGCGGRHPPSLGPTSVSRPTTGLGSPPRSRVREPCPPSPG